MCTDKVWVNIPYMSAHAAGKTLPSHTMSFFVCCCSLFRSPYLLSGLALICFSRSLRRDFALNAYTIYMFSHHVAIYFAINFIIIYSRRTLQIWVWRYNIQSAFFHLLFAILSYILLVKQFALYCDKNSFEWVFNLMNRLRNKQQIFHKLSSHKVIQWRRNGNNFNDNIWMGWGKY